ncbi:MAG: hypothetical protein KDA22_05075 [Phycisphaerales bacterium]|nr:hypothetical protein [Phycisphaerales bacterium]
MSTRAPIGILGRAIAALALSSAVLAAPPVDDGDRSSAPVKEAESATAAGVQGTSADRGLLAGPTVTDAAADGTGGFAGGGMNAGRQSDRRDPVPPRVWFRVLSTLELDPAQRERVQAVAQEFQAEARAFQKANGPAIKELEARMKEMGPGGSKELRSKMQALRSKAPKAEPSMERIWKMLTPEQQDEFKARLDELRKQRSRGSGDAMRPDEAMRSGDAMRSGEAKQPGDAMRPGDAGAPDGPRRPRTRPGGAPPRSRTAPPAGGPV